jgi:hypothetical protein
MQAGENTVTGCCLRAGDLPASLPRVEKITIRSAIREWVNLILGFLVRLFVGHQGLHDSAVHQHDERHLLIIWH